MTSISVPTPGRRDWATSTHPAGRRGVVPVVLFFFVLWTNLAVVLTQVHGVPQFIGSSVVVLLLIPIVRALIVERQAPVVTPVLPLVLIFLGTLFLAGDQVAGTVRSSRTTSASTSRKASCSISSSRTR